MIRLDPTEDQYQALLDKMHKFNEACKEFASYGLKKLFTKDTNHCISKKVVAKAKDTRSLVSLEDLKRIRERRPVRKSQRHDHFSRSCAKLREVVTFKATIADLPLVFMDPAIVA